MRRLLKCLAVLLCLMCATTALAEIQLAPQVEMWDMTQPLEIDLRADVAAHMPYDDLRCAQLNALMKHMSLRLNTTTAENDIIGRVALQVGGRDVAWLMQKENAGETQLRLSWQPDVTYSAAGNALESFMGDETPVLSLYGVSGDRQQWLEDGPALFAGMGEALEDYKSASSIKTTIKNMGMAREKIIYTVPKSKAELFAQAVANHCPAGSLSDFLTSLTYSGQQKLIVWLDGDGRMLRAEYAGKCGVDEDSLRQVSLVWRMCRTEDAIRDDITLKTPAVKGEDYNTLTVIRNLLRDEQGAVSMDGKFSYTVRESGKKSTHSGEGKMTSAPEGEATRLKGSVTVKQKLPGADYASGTVLKPDVILRSDGTAPMLSGTVQVQEMYGDNVVEDATIHVDVAAGNALRWEDSFATVDMNAMDQEQLNEMLSGLSSAVVPHLVLLPTEDTLYLSADLPEVVWQKIVEAARETLSEEETP